MSRGEGGVGVALRSRPVGSDCVDRFQSGGGSGVGWRCVRRVEEKGGGGGDSFSELLKW